ncbi:unnamed protein product [Rotaria sp. Silwood2]|nr:unnamed protein product [Rotaria sp. Silwood2]CAF4150136.1 unnamed protein product [Rotaria sp. Silwood2]
MKKNINELEEEDESNQPSVVDEDDFHQSSTTTRPVLASQSNLLMMIQNAPVAPFDVQDFSFNLNSKEIHQIIASQTLPLTQQWENETDLAENRNKSCSTTTRKRKTTQRSSSFMSTPKSSARLTAKRIRLQ